MEVDDVETEQFRSDWRFELPRGNLRIDLTLEQQIGADLNPLYIYFERQQSPNAVCRLFSKARHQTQHDKRD